MNSLKPLSRVAYWNEELKELWKPRISRIRRAYKDTELATVLTGMRDVYVYHVESTNFGGSYDMLRENDMVFFPIRTTAVYRGFSHRHLPPEKGKPYMIYGAAVKRENIDAGRLFKELSTRDTGRTDHTGTGKLLGYPEQDIEFFTRVWPKVSIDPMYEAAIETPGAVVDEKAVTVNCHPYCNSMLRYFGVRITPQLTHTMQAEQSIAWGEEWMEIMRQYDEEAAQWAWELLSIPITWDCYRGVVVVDTPVFRGVANSDTTETRKRIINQGWPPGEGN